MHAFKFEKKNALGFSHGDIDTPYSSKTKKEKKEKLALPAVVGPDLFVVSLALELTPRNWAFKLV